MIHRPGQAGPIAAARARRASRRTPDRCIAGIRPAARAVRLAAQVATAAFVESVMGPPKFLEEGAERAPGVGIVAGLDVVLQRLVLWVFAGS